MLENSCLWEGKHRAVRNTQICGGYECSFLLASEGGCVCVQLVPSTYPEKFLLLDLNPTVFPVA